jgi:pimeloyl-ACP methyl ester carboxylesterase
VVYLHEAGIDRAVARRTPVALAARAAGLDVAVPELPGHGLRARDQDYDRNAQRIATVTTVAREVAALLSGQGAQGARGAAVLGGSLGGLCAIASAIGDARVRRVAVWLTPLFWSADWPGADSVDAAAYDPARHVERLLRLDLLMLLGENDAWASPAPILRTVPDSRRFSRAGGRLTVEVLAGHGHVQSPVIADRVVRWLCAPADRETAGEYRQSAREYRQSARE